MIAAERRHHRHARVWMTGTNTDAERVFDIVHRSAPDPNIVGQNGITGRSRAARAMAGLTIVTEHRFTGGAGELLQLSIARQVAA